MESVSEFFSVGSKHLAKTPVLRREEVIAISPKPFFSEGSD